MKIGYRVEINNPKYGGPQYYLAKHFRAAGKKVKVRKYIGRENPSPKQVGSLSLDHAYDMEQRAILKRVEENTAMFASEYLDPEQIKLLEEIRFTHKAIKPLMAGSEIDAIEQDLTIRYVSGTTFIEGNTLTLKQTARLWEEGVNPKDKTLREIFEVQNFKKVLDYRTKYKRHIDGRFVRRLNELILDNIDLEMAGVFRRGDNIGIAGFDIILTPAVLIEDELNELIAQYYDDVSTKGIHPFEAAVVFHYNFERIHPFNDGNGRTGRELLNYQLMRGGYPPIIISGKERERYIGSFDNGDQGEMKELVDVYFDLYTEFWLERLRKNLKEFTTPVHEIK